jgi:hypothetical protein
MFRGDVDEKLVKLYSNILQFQAQAASQFDHNTFIRALRNGAKLEDWQGLLDKIYAAENECMKFLNLVGLNSSDQSFTHLQESLSQLQRGLEKVYLLLEESHKRGIIASYQTQSIDNVSFGMKTPDLYNC